LLRGLERREHPLALQSIRGAPDIVRYRIAPLAAAAARNDGHQKQWEERAARPVHALV
jgi:uncharacterized membrane protein